jgi:hypothetical protein
LQEKPAGEEATHMRLKWAIVVVALCLIVTVAAVAYAAGKTSAPEVIQAQRFELVDSEGKVRAVLGMADDGGSGLAVMGEGGRARLAMGTKADGSVGLAVLRETGTPVVAIGLGADGAAGLAVLDKQGNLTWAAP